jgi:futalosine hydrolase
MKILLCAATEMEIAASIPTLASMEKHKVELVITGVGLMTSTYALAKAIGIHHPELVIQAGIAGTLQQDQPLGEVVVVQNETIGDLGVLEAGGFRSLFDLKLLSTELTPWKNGQLANEHELLNKIGLKLVNGVTVNEISTDQQTIHYYRNQLKAEIETMEGAALHYVGLMEKIPFLQIRSLSNYIGERDKKKWDIKMSIANLNRELQRLLKKDFML